MNYLGVIDYKSTEEVIALVEKNLSNFYNIIIHINGFGVVERSSLYWSKFEQQLLCKKIILTISENNVGFSGGCNFIIDEFLSKSDGEFLIICNDDMVLDFNIVEKYFRSARDYDIQTISGTKILNEKNEIIHTTYSLDKIMFLPNRFHKHAKRFYSKELFVETADIVHGCFLIYSKEILKAVKNARGFVFDERFFAYREETELQLFVKHILKKNIYYINDEGIVHFGSASTGGKNNFIVLYYLNRNSLLLASIYFNYFKQALYFLYHCAAYGLYSIARFKWAYIYSFYKGLSHFFKKNYGEFR